MLLLLTLPHALLAPRATASLHARARPRAVRPCAAAAAGSGTPPGGSGTPSSGTTSSGAQRRRALDADFAAIAVPALAQFAAEPIAGLVDTAYLGRLGVTALGGAGVAISAHYATAKLFNDPLLRTSISIVASGDGAGETERDGAISAALVLALAVGLLQAAFFAVAAPSLISVMGVAPGSAMRPVAVSYLRVRALGMPAATLWLVANGIFRGLGDTRTPLKWALLFSALNAALDPLFIFPLRMGAAGAAAGTALSQSLALVGLLRVLRARTGVPISPAVLLAPASLRRLAPSLRAYGTAGVLVFLRTWGKVAAYTYCSRTAAGLGAVASAAHLLCFNLGVVLSQLCESVAVATQTLLARAMGTLRRSAAAGAAAAEGTDARDSQGLPMGREAVAVAAAAAAARSDAWHVIRRGALVGGAIASALTAATAARPAAVIAGLTTDTSVRAACATIVAPVLACQLFKGLAFPANGVVMGGLDWGFATAEVWAGTALCIALVHLPVPFSAASAAARPAVPSLTSIWIGLAAFMASQTLFSVARVASRAGPWALLFHRDRTADAAK